MRFSLVARKVCGRCTEGVWEVHRRCTEVYGRCVGGARKVSIATIDLVADNRKFEV